MGEVEDSPSKQYDTKTMAQWPVIFLFVASMIGHELALESLSTTYMFFPHLATSITLFQFGFCVLLPLLVSHTCAGGDAMQSFPRSLKELWVYIKLSAIVYGATAFATMSLNCEGVTYITKVVFKSAKLIPTMIVGVVMDARAERSGFSIKKRQYSMWDYASAVLLCVGAAGFCISPNGSGYEGNDGTKVDSQRNGPHWVGISLLGMSVFCDALVPNLQHQLMHGIGCASSITKVRKVNDDELELTSLMGEEEQGGHKIPITQHHLAKPGLSSHALMVNTNSIGLSLLLLSTVIRLSFLPIISFTSANPQFLLLNLTVGLGLGTAVLSFTELVRRSGPATAVAAATLRKVITVVLSYVIFPKQMSRVHAISSGFVAMGLMVAYVGQGKK